MLYGMRQSPQWEALEKLNLKADQPLMEGKTVGQVMEMSKAMVSGEEKLIMAGENRSMMGMVGGLGASLSNGQ